LINSAAGGKNVSADVDIFVILRFISFWPPTIQEFRDRLNGSIGKVILCFIVLLLRINWPRRDIVQEAAKMYQSELLHFLKW
jgi:hypothetical protein